MGEKEEVKQEKIEKKDNEVRIGIHCSDWPYSHLKEWEDDCKQNYNNIRWIKMYQDHKQAKLLETLLDLIGSIKADVEEVRERLFMIEKGKELKEDDDDEGVSLMGGAKGSVKG